jgi:L-ascorbate metabolism protein UlaG (beta-lactamase superfamily)
MRILITSLPSPSLAVLVAGAAVEIWAPAPVVSQLAEAGASPDRVREAVPGDSFTAAGFAVRTVGGQHAVIHPDIPQVANLGYLVEQKALHPGDSFVDAPDDSQVEILFLPISAPWLKVAEAVEAVE